MGFLGLRCLVIALAAMGQTACNPALNWRETRIDDTALVALLPCKPDRGARQIQFASQILDMRMTGCDAGDASFAVAQVKLSLGVPPARLLAQWRDASLATLGATDFRERALDRSETGLPAGSLLVSANGRRPDGSAVQMQGVWFARDDRIFQAVVYAEKFTPDMTEPFFSGLKFQ